ncbi:MAG: prephenate dehydratase [Gammaproteobacteria bacterium]
MSDQTFDLGSIREQIDALDASIQELVTQRARLALQVAEAKRRSGETSNFYRPEREAQVLDLAVGRNEGPLADETIIRLFREIMSACLALQEPLKIAFLGPEGTFSQEAAIKHFGHALQTLAMGSIDQVFREVEAGSAHYGVVPIENSTEGSVNFTLDMFVRSPVRICGEVELRVHHNLLANESAYAGIERVYSHPQSLAQCREWLDANLPHAERIPVSSNAEGARMAAAESGGAAIAGQIAAEIHGISVLAETIEDEPDNTTRFAIIGTQDVGPTGDDKTSLLLSVDNEPGALYGMLAPFSEHDISMTRVESRPSRRGNWDYVFFVDVLGHADDPGVRDALMAVRSKASLFRVLGSYPATRT